MSPRQAPRVTLFGAAFWAMIVAPAIGTERYGDHDAPHDSPAAVVRSLGGQNVHPLLAEVGERDQVPLQFDLVPSFNDSQDIDELDGEDDCVAVAQREVGRRPVNLAVPGTVLTSSEIEPACPRFLSLCRFRC